MRSTRQLLTRALEWDCLGSWNLYRTSLEAMALQAFLEEVSPGCVRSSTSEKIAMPTTFMDEQPLFNGYFEIRTVYFRPEMTARQKSNFESTRRELTQQVERSEDRLDASPWWWVDGLQQFKEKIAIAARFAFFWRTVELENNYNPIGTRWDAPLKDRDAGVDSFQEDLDAAGAVGSTSVHCTFFGGPWTN